MIYDEQAWTNELARFLRETVREQETRASRDASLTDFSAGFLAGRISGFKAALSLADVMMGVKPEEQ